MKNQGISDLEPRRMTTRSLDRSFDLEALREIERSLRGKLNALKLPPSFIDRTVEDAIQKGMVEYLRKLDRGEVVDNRDAFVVHAAFRRAIDELRREARLDDGTAVEAVIESGSVAEPPTDEVAIEYLQAEELRQAVGQLSPEEQQVLRLHYFEELTAEASAKSLFCSERTYSRRLKQTLRKLGQILDAPVPEPGSDLAIEIGVVTFLLLGGATVPISQGPMESVARLAEGLVGRTGGGETGERALAIASSGPAKAAGACAALAATCLLAVGGAELAGIGAGTPERPEPDKSVAVERPTPRPEARVVIAPPVPVPTSSSPTDQATKATSRETSPAAAAKQRERQANKEVESQGTGALFPEESSPEPTPEPAPVETSPPPASESSPNGVVGSQGAAGLVSP